MVSKFNKIYFSSVPLFCVSIPMIIVGIIMWVELGKIPDEYQKFDIYSYYYSSTVTLLQIGVLVLLIGVFFTLLFSFQKSSAANSNDVIEDGIHDNCKPNKRKLSKLLLVNVPLQCSGITLILIGMTIDSKFGGFFGGEFELSFYEYPIWATMDNILVPTKVIGLILSLFGIFLLIIYFFRRFRSKKKDQIEPTYEEVECMIK